MKRLVENRAKWLEGHRKINRPQLKYKAKRRLRKTLNIK